MHYVKIHYFMSVVMLDHINTFSTTFHSTFF